MKVAVLPAQIIPAGDTDMLTDGVTGDVSDKLPKLVNVVIPAIPGGTDGVDIIPEAEAVDVACTCSPVIVN